MSELKSFDRVADVYDETRGLPVDVEAQIATAIEATLRSVSATPSIVEIGVGTGRIAVPLAERGVQVTGTDISSKMLARLRSKRDDIAVLFAEGANPPFRDAVFDAALFVHILHLVPDVEATVRATMRLVHPGGLMLSGTDSSREGIRGRADVLITETVREVAGVAVTGWKPYEGSRQVFERVLEQSGATMERIDAAEWRGKTSAKRVHERLAARDFSSSWQIPEDALPEILRRVEPRLVELFGGWEVEREFPRGFGLVVGRLPG